MSSRSKAKDSLAALRAARAKGSRIDTWQPKESDIYDNVSDDQYKAIVGDRLEQDDFIVDDDGSGYVDNGQDDWGDEKRRRGGSDDEDDSEEERNTSKKKSVKAKPERPKATMSDYRRPPTAAYRPQVSALNEQDFMASLLSSVTAAPSPGSASDSRKRKSSPDFTNPSSEPDAEPSSDHGFWDSQASSERFTMDAVGSKPHAADAPMDVDDDLDFSMDMDGGEVIAPPSDDEEEEMAVRQVKREPLTPMAANTKNGSNATLGAQLARRRAVNASATAIKPLPVTTKVEPKATPTPSKVAPPTVTAKRAKHIVSWQSVAETVVNTDPAIETVKAQLNSTIEPMEDDGSLRMFWFDYLEVNDVLHLIGKVKDRASGRYVSCCVTVKNIDRNLFVLPRKYNLVGGRETDEEVEWTDVHNELKDDLKRAGVESAFKDKPVKRNYAFEDKTVPKGEQTWYKIKYSFDQPALPADSSGRTYSHVFGANNTPFELFVIKRKIMGPCWLRIVGAEKSAQQASWCKTEYTVLEPKDVNPFSETDASAPKDVPPLTMMSLSVRTIVNHRENKTEILCATARVWEGCNVDDPTPTEKLPSSVLTLVRPIVDKFPGGFEEAAKAKPKAGVEAQSKSRSKTQGKNDEEVQTVQTPITTVKAERILLNQLLSFIQKHDPDVLIGHNFLASTLEALLYRMKELKTDHWSRIGRFRRTKFQISKANSNAKLVTGRLIADLSSDVARGMIASTTWSLTEMVDTVLGFEREDIDPEATAGFFDPFADTPHALLKFVRAAEIDAYFQMAVASRVQMLALTRQLTNLAGNAWSQTLNGGRAIRNEFILLHEFHRLKYVCPDRQGWVDKKAVRENADDGEDAPVKGKRPKYAGGLVFEPKRGLWDTYIMVMDFNSLYPSIIQEYNIDFTTVERDDDENALEEKIPDVPQAGITQGVLPRIIANLVNRRKQVKSLMKDKSNAAKLQQWDIKQQALKLTANSMYGCLGFQGSRFFARPLAALTTFKGREILTATKELAEGMSLDVVYGDTDSVFINSNVTTYPEALKIANEFKKLVNDRYKLLEIDLDNVFERVLLLNKKKYAAVVIDEAGVRKTEVKGLDLKRREYSPISKDASGAVLQQILSGADTEDVVVKIHELLTKLGQAVRDGKVALKEFIILKRLGKDPSAYPDAKAQPHVQVALRMLQRNEQAKSGDVVPYIICLGEDGKTSKTAASNKAFHPYEITREGSNLRIDYEYYLDNQILQPVLRLCEPIEGTDRARLAECLGLDPARYRTQTATDVVEREFFTFDSQIPDKERFKDAVPLMLRCPSCEDSFVFEGLLEDSANMIRATGIHCASCESSFSVATIAVQLDNAIREHIARYYLGWTVCDGDGCGSRTRMMSVYGRRCLGLEVPDCQGTVKLEYSDSKLYNQLLFYLSLFDTDKVLDGAKGLARFEELASKASYNREILDVLSNMANRYLDKCGRRYVDLGGLFGFMDKIKL